MKNFQFFFYFIVSLMTYKIIKFNSRKMHTAHFVVQTRKSRNEATTKVDIICVKTRVQNFSFLMRKQTGLNQKSFA